MNAEAPRSFFEKALDVLWFGLCLWIVVLFLAAGCAIANWRPEKLPAKSASLQSCPIGNSFWMIVDYGVPARDLLSACQADELDARIVSRLRPAGSGRRVVEARLLDFGSAISSLEAFKRINGLGFKPADLWELGAFHAGCPRMQQGTSIIALGGAINIGAGFHLVPFLWSWQGKPRLSYYLWGFGWNEGELFLAVRR